jgi:hypothetical protein
MAEQLITTEVPEGFIEPDGTRPGKLIVKAGEVSIWRNQFGKQGVPSVEDLQAWTDDGMALEIQAEFDKVYSGTDQYKVKKIKLASGDKAQRAVEDKKEQPRVTNTFTRQELSDIKEEAKQRDIHWQVAIYNAVDLLKGSQVKTEDFSEDWTYDFIREVSNRIYNIIENGPRPIEEEHEPDPVEDLGDDDNPQTEMVV